MARPRFFLFFFLIVRNDLYTLISFSFPSHIQLGKHAHAQITTQKQEDAERKPATHTTTALSTIDRHGHTTATTGRTTTTRRSHHLTSQIKVSISIMKPFSSQILFLLN
jgi:hypothetical protein